MLPAALSGLLLGAALPEGDDEALVDEGAANPELELELEAGVAGAVPEPLLGAVVPLLTTVVMLPLLAMAALLATAVPLLETAVAMEAPVEDAPLTFRLLAVGISATEEVAAPEGLGTAAGEETVPAGAEEGGAEAEGTAEAAGELISVGVEAGVMLV